MWTAKKAADIEMPAEWFEAKKRTLSDWLATPVKGSDFEGVASKIEEFAEWLASVVKEAVDFSRYNPYFAKEIERQWKFWDAEQKLRWCATRYKSAVSALRSETPFGTFAAKAVLDNYDRTVKTLANAIENEPEISWRPLRDLESRLRGKAPSAVSMSWDVMPPTPEFLAYMKETKAREKVLANAVEKRPAVNTLKVLDRFFLDIGRSKYLDPSLYEDRGIARELSIGKAKVIILDPGGDLDGHEGGGVRRIAEVRRHLQPWHGHRGVDGLRSSHPAPHHRPRVGSPLLVPSCEAIAACVVQRHGADAGPRRGR